MYRPHQRLEKRAFLYSAAAIAAVLLLGLLAFWLIPAQEADPLLAIDPNSKQGPLPGQTDDPTPVEEGAARYRMNRAVWYPASNKEGTVLFQSDSGNCHLLQISYEVQGETVYQSGLLEPGSHISKAKLTRKLPAGIYDGVCRIRLIEKDSRMPLGDLEEEITLTVNA